jgi:hypothetical protein
MARLRTFALIKAACSAAAPATALKGKHDIFQYSSIRQSSHGSHEP